MRFADPHACPSCGGGIAGEQRCRHCNVDLSSPAALQLWQTLIQADSLLDQARRDSVGPSAVAAPPAPQIGSPPGVAPSFPHPGAPAAAAPARPGRHWSTGSIILGLGALCLLVAALIFITVSWDVLGPTGRTLVLLVITLAIAAAAVWLTRARLRASAEALWAVFFGLFAIDFFAAREYGLLGLDAFTVEQAGLVFGVLAAVVGGAIVLISRRTLPLIVPSGAAGLAVWTASFSLAATLGWQFFWCVLGGLALAAVATAIAWRLSMALVTWVAGAAVAVLYAMTAGGAIEEIVESPHLADLAGDAQGVPMLVTIALTAAIGLAAPRLTIPAAALVTLGAASLVFAPSEAAAEHEGGFLSASAMAVVLTFALARGAHALARGARIAAASILAALAVASLGWVGNAVDAVDQSNGNGFGTSWTVHLANPDVLPGPGWLAIVSFGAIAASVFAVLRWPEVGAYARPLDLSPAVIGAFGLVVGVIAYEPLVLPAALLVLAAGIGLLVLARRDAASSAGDVWLAVSLLAAVMPAGMVFASKPVALVVWLVVAATLATVARFFSPVWARQASTFGAAALVIGAAAVAADLAPWGDLGVRLTAVVVSVLALVVASFALHGFVGRPEIEVAAGLGVVATLLSAAEMGLGSQALIWAVVGVPLVVLGLFVGDRNWLRYAGSAVLGVAWVLVLRANDVETIEAYTSPFAVVLLGAGLWAMRRDPQLSTMIALTPGLTVALVPSIPQALADPTGPRALLLGLAGLLALVVGIWQKWQMPFVYGSLLVTLLVVWNVGPLANGLPRWILIAVAGVILIGSGITWENRVQNAKSAALYVQNLR
ncbi:MAG: SCO7613 C-terminal domain-containing membrane protein [Aeromicrobium sp.]